MATLLVCLGAHEEALRYLRRCLKSNPGAPDFYLICRVEALIGLGRFDQALSDLERILSRQPDWLMAHALAAIANEAAGNREAARAAVANIRDLNAGFTVSLWRRFLFYPERADVADLCALLVRAGLPEA